MSCNDTRTQIALLILAALIVAIVGAGWTWYRAGVQAQVYRRQGVTMSQWEVFIGAKPVERAIVPRIEP